jgi:hypothetical protein
MRNPQQLFEDKIRSADLQQQAAALQPQGTART